MGSTKRHIYFIGVGGIGMSALARYFKNKGAQVSGYDKTPSPLTRKLVSEGINVSFLDEVDEIPSAILNNKLDALIVYTPAIPTDNKLLNYFKTKGYSLKKRSEVLGIITAETNNLSVAGTHGKTTTSCMVASIFQYSDKQFSAFLGGISTNLGSNYYYQEGHGKTQYSITEADEFDRSFLRLSPDYTVITSTDADHLDIYGNKDDLEKSYVEFSELVKNPKNIFYAMGKAHNIEGISYSASNNSAAYYAEVSSKDGRGTRFSICNNLNLPTFDNLYLNIPGLHNLENAVGAALMCLKAGISINAIAKGLQNFGGIKRRFEYVIDREDIIYIDDYAHHPSELNAIITSVKELYPDKKITAIFQPHLFTRTRDFMDDFAKELSLLDELILLPIYPARELPIEGVNSRVILSKMNIESAIVLEKEEVINSLKERKIDVLLTLGAGDIDRLVEPIKELLSINNGR